ncbi:DUF2919 family protein [Neptunicella sp. SCSIO 80796]|uniref:DUF2919 family protein n=1 Tax=Neptunicella plasticusilytica TaxID=3117012 RepID=UPI003A4D83AB
MLPLKHYDQQGRVKPLASFLFCLLYLARGYVVFVISMSYRADTGLLLGLFYPQKYDFYASLLLGIPAILLALVMIYRDKLWERHYLFAFKWIKPLLLITLLADFLLHLQQGYNQGWQFSWILAATFIVDISLIYYFIRSRYFSAMIRDWAIPAAL